ncbi:MAG: EamA family transporter [Chloroflexi bacterium]|nr:EamA family transporter [Chloroflexota bacterium]
MTIKQAWLGFWVLALIWGSSYLFIRIGVAQVPPFQLVFIRTGIAAIGLNVVAYARGKRLPTDSRSLGDLLFLGIVNTVFPFALITWGETHIESSLASVLQGTTVLFTLVLAHFAFVDERITLRKVAGLVIGFLGVVVLAGRSTGETITGTRSNLHLLGQLAIIGSSLCYAIGGIYGRKALQNRLEPIVVSAGAMTVAAITTGIIAYLSPIFGGPAPVGFNQLAPNVLGAVLALGILNTFGAYLIYYSLLAALGAARTSMITYVIPVVGLLLGVLFLGEQVDGRLLIGTLLIVGGIALVNLKFAAVIGNLRARLAGRANVIRSPTDLP